MKRDKRQGEGGKEGEEMQWMEDHAREDWGARWIKLFDRRLEWTRHCMNCMYSEKIFVARIFYVTGYTCSEFDWFWVGVTGSHMISHWLEEADWALNTLLEHSFLKRHLISYLESPKLGTKGGKKNYLEINLRIPYHLILLPFILKKKNMRWLRFLMKLRGKV